jgi:flagellar biosynthesis protein FlgN
MNHDARLHLEVLLDREIELARSLGEALDAEKTALTGQSPEAVSGLAAQKTRLFETIEKLEHERRALCANPSGPGIAASVVARWRSLMALMAGCRNANELNGYIIRVRQHQIRQLIDIVRGRPAPITYDTHGKTFANALRALAKA